VRASAPTRIDLAGGTIDIWPIYLFHDGASTLNAAISLRAHVEIDARTDGAIELRSIDTHRTVRAARWSELDGGGDGGKDQRHDNERQWIAWRDVEDERRHQPCRRRAPASPTPMPAPVTAAA